MGCPGYIEQRFDRAWHWAGGDFVRRRVDAGDPNFIKMWNEMGGKDRFDRRRRWWVEHQNRFENALE